MRSSKCRKLMLPAVEYLPRFFTIRASVTALSPRRTATPAKIAIECFVINHQQFDWRLAHVVIQTSGYSLFICSAICCSNGRIRATIWRACSMSPPSLDCSSAWHISAAGQRAPIVLAGDLCGAPVRQARPYFSCLSISSISCRPCCAVCTNLSANLCTLTGSEPIIFLQRGQIYQVQNNLFSPAQKKPCFRIGLPRQDLIDGYFAAVPPKPFAMTA